MIWDWVCLSWDWVLFDLGFVFYDCRRWLFYELGVGLFDLGLGFCDLGLVWGQSPTELHLQKHSSKLLKVPKALYQSKYFETLSDLVSNLIWVLVEKSRKYRSETVQSDRPKSWI